jgi:DinB superfamily
LLLGYISVSASPLSNHADPISVVIAQFQQLHSELLLEVANRDDESLNWTPCPGANSVATIVTHTLGSEAETLRAVVGVPGGRDRDAEFKMGRQSRADLLDKIRRAESLLDDLAPMLTDDRARILTALPTLSNDDRRPGMTWLIGNLGHAREHMGHVRLTVQLYDAAFNPRS